MNYFRSFLERIGHGWRGRVQGLEVPFSDCAHCLHFRYLKFRFLNLTKTKLTQMTVIFAFFTAIRKSVVLISQLQSEQNVKYSDCSYKDSYFRSQRFLQVERANRLIIWECWVVDNNVFYDTDLTQWHYHNIYLCKNIININVTSYNNTKRSLVNI